ncbi:MAG: DUF2480 family protein [Marinirhabdus sp.]
MKNEIINRVAASKLVTLDLGDLYPAGQRVAFDISQWLAHGTVLIEKDFRKHISQHDWPQYKGNYVALHCSTGAIVPGWAFMLVGLALTPFAKKTVVGTLPDLENLLFSETIAGLDVSAHKGKPVIIKGCATKPIPQNAYVLLAQKLRPVAKSIMYGEACSSVPLFKNKG